MGNSISSENCFRFRVERKSKEGNVLNFKMVAISSSGNGFSQLFVEPVTKSKNIDNSYFQYK
jgi:hypothetical protein